MSIPFHVLMKKPVSEMLTTKHVRVVEPETSIEEVLNTMKSSGIGSMLIVEAGKPVGVFTERDYIKRIAGKGMDLSKEKIKDYMTEDPHSVERHEPVGQVIMKMHMGGFRHVVVFDLDGNSELDVLSIKDIMSYLVDSMIDGFVSEYRKSA